MSNIDIIQSHGGGAARNLDNLPKAIGSIPGGLTPQIIVTTDGAQVYAEKGSEHVDGVKQSDGTFKLEVSLGTWTVTAIGETTKTENVTLSTVSRNKLKIVTVTPKSVGGRIYYVDSTAAGGIYHFYDADGNELTTQTVDGLANAVTYVVESKASKDKFYVYATQNGNPSDNILMSDELEWGSYGTSQGTTANTRDSGKTNSAKCLSSLGSTSGTIWNWLRGLRGQSKNGQSDWFIGSMVELDDLRTGRTSGKSIFSNNYIWSSVEDSTIRSYRWLFSMSQWRNDAKDYTNCAVALRSF